MNVHRPYPEGFHKLPLEERNEHFKEEAAKYEDQQRATAEVVQLEPRAAKGSGKRNPAPSLSEIELARRFVDRLLIPEEAAPQFLDDAAPRNGMMPPPIPR
jgi:hypothetical protein